MTDDKSRDEQPADARPEPDWRRRRRVAAVFGDVLPDTTRDEREPAGGRDDSEEWLRRQVPPHHGS